MSIDLPRRSHSKLDSIPGEFGEAVRLQVRDWLVEGRTYESITERLNELFIEENYDERISRSAVAAWAKRQRSELERVRRANEKAQILAKHLVPEDGGVEKASMGLTHALLLEALTDAQPVQVKSIEDLTKCAHAVGRLQSSQVQREKWESERRARVDEAVEFLKKGLEAELRDHPDLVERLAPLVDRTKQHLIADNPEEPTA